MSVPETQRGQAKLQVLVDARYLAKYTLQITANEKVFKPEYQRSLTDDIVKTAKDIFTMAWTANNIRVGDDIENWNERKRLQEMATRKCNDLLALIDLAKPVFHLSAKRVKYWGKLTIKVRQEIRNWKTGDSKRYEKK